MEGDKSRTGPWTTLKAVVFDLDDTLVLSTVDFGKFRALVIDRMVELGEDRGSYDLSETIVRILDRYERRMRGRGLVEEEVRRRLAELDGIMDRVELEKVDETGAIEGARELLAFLRGKGVRVGILTRGCARYAESALTVTGLADLVDAVESRNSHTRPKPHPDSYMRLVEALGVAKEHTLFVGNHGIDAGCAAEAGVPFVGVMTGDVPERALRDAGAVKVVEDLGELRGWLASVLGD